MKEFLIQVALRIVPALFIFLFLLYLPIPSDTLRQFDHFGCIKLAPGKFHSAIIGTSRAQQGLSPEILTPEIGSNFFNLAFNLGQSSWTKSYVTFCRHVLLKNQEKLNYTFVEINPWALDSATIHAHQSPCMIAELVEADRASFCECRHHTAVPKEYFLSSKSGDDLVSQSFNCLETMSASYFKRMTSTGWLFHSQHNDFKRNSYRSTGDVLQYKKKAKPLSWPWPESENNLRDLLDTLDAYSEQIIFVRMPLLPEFKSVEDSIFPDFNRFISELSEIRDYDYFDFSDSIASREYFHDASHLNFSGAKHFSRVLVSKMEDGTH
jgi:hypothetical protein